ncbi:beta-N-acetylhexosaminidase [Paenibacillus herberti]|nr:beta-N-acetylhexosaminidase [Paenibacillus herberti]
MRLKRKSTPQLKTRTAFMASLLLVAFVGAFVHWNIHAADSTALSLTGIAPVSAHPPAPLAASQEPIQWPTAPALTLEQQTTLADKVMAMSLSDKVGQLIIAGLDGELPDAATRAIINNREAGGFILFRSNMESVSSTVSLTNRLKELNRRAGGEPLFLAVDEEGGRVSRLPSSVDKLPSSGEVGKNGSEAYARAAGEQLAKRVKAFGFNVNFAPVLDVNSNPDNPVIGDRSFGSSPSLVAKLGIAELEAHKNNGVLGVVKHFPGHGDTAVDSHLELPVLDNGMSRLKQLELPPFEAAIDNGAEAVMVAHILLPKLDPDAPASLSKPIISGLLRDKLGFDGLVISDDLTMGAINDNYHLGDAAVRFILAGGDVALVCHGSDKISLVYDSLKKAVSRGTISTQRLNESVYRVLALKTVYKLADQPIPVPAIEQLNKQMEAALAPYRTDTP